MPVILPCLLSCSLACGLSISKLMGVPSLMEVRILVRTQAWGCTRDILQVCYMCIRCLCFLVVAVMFCCCQGCHVSPVCDFLGCTCSCCVPGAYGCSQLLLSYVERLMFCYWSTWGTPYNFCYHFCCLLCGCQHCPSCVLQHSVWRHPSRAPRPKCVSPGCCMDIVCSLLLSGWCAGTRRNNC